MDAETKQQVMANLFPAARPAVEPWDRFPWHLGRGGKCDSSRPHSAQAMAIDVFGTLRVAAQGERDAILSAIAHDLGLPEGGPWRVELEWLDPENRLREKRRTQVDAIAWGRDAVIFFECKFSERDGGECSQPNPLHGGAHDGIVQCDGRYRMQTNPVNGQQSRCALAGKGIRYWEVIPQVFRFGAEDVHDPCPFHGPWFQWMRNLTLCHEIARTEGLQLAFVIAYADAPHLPFAQRLNSDAWSTLVSALQPSAVAFRTIPFQSLVRQAEKCAQAAGARTDVWADLARWVDEKINKVSAAYAP